MGAGGDRDGYRFFQYLFNMNPLRASMMSPRGIPRVDTSTNKEGAVCRPPEDELPTRVVTAQIPTANAPSPMAIRMGIKVL